VLARAINLLVARGSYREATRIYPEDLIELRQGARDSPVSHAVCGVRCDRAARLLFMDVGQEGYRNYVELGFGAAVVSAARRCAESCA